jgi:protein-S-isoprenylcysteine O-methyltransferase Ste14
MDLTRIIRVAWMLVFTIWAGAADSARGPVQSKEGWGARISVWVIGAAWLILLFRRFPGPLGSQIINPPQSIVIAGVVVTLIGLSFAVWARFYLGKNWDALITLKLDHKLIRTGPYAIVRHPIYSGFMLAGLGTAFAVGQIRSFIAAAMIVAAWVYKSGLEESFLLEHFGSAYAEYRRNVKRLIPFVW